MSQIPANETGNAIKTLPTKAINCERNKRAKSWANELCLFSFFDCFFMPLSSTLIKVEAVIAGCFVANV